MAQLQLSTILAGLLESGGPTCPPPHQFLADAWVGGRLYPLHYYVLRQNFRPSYCLAQRRVKQSAICRKRSTCLETIGKLVLVFFFLIQHVSNQNMQSYSYEKKVSCEGQPHHIFFLIYSTLYEIYEMKQRPNWTSYILVVFNVNQVII